MSNLIEEKFLKNFDIEKKICRRSEWWSRQCSFSFLNKKVHK